MDGAVIDAEVSRMASQEMPAHLDKLMQSQQNLDQLASYCRTLYAQPDTPRAQYQQHVQQTRAYATQSLQSLAFQLGQCAQTLHECLSVQMEWLDGQGHEIHAMSQRLISAHEINGRRAVGDMQKAALTDPAVGDKMKKCDAPVYLVSAQGISGPASKYATFSALSRAGVGSSGRKLDLCELDGVGVSLGTAGDTGTALGDKFRRDHKITAASALNSSGGMSAANTSTGAIPTTTGAQTGSNSALASSTMPRNPVGTIRRGTSSHMGSHFGTVRGNNRMSMEGSGADGDVAMPQAPAMPSLPPGFGSVRAVSSSNTLPRPSPAATSEVANIGGDSEASLAGRGMSNSPVGTINRSSQGIFAHGPPAQASMSALPSMPAPLPPPGPPPPGASVLPGPRPPPGPPPPAGPPPPPGPPPPSAVGMSSLKSGANLSLPASSGAPPPPTGPPPPGASIAGFGPPPPRPPGVPPSPTVGTAAPGGFPPPPPGSGVKSMGQAMPGGLPPAPPGVPGKMLPPSGMGSLPPPPPGPGMMRPPGPPPMAGMPPPPPPGAPFMRPPLPGGMPPPAANFRPTSMAAAPSMHPPPPPSGPAPGGMPPPPPPQAAPPTAADVAAVFVRVLYAYQAVSPEELDISPGEVLKVVGPDVGDGWLEGYSETRAAKGLFPSGYVTKL